MALGKMEEEMSIIIEVFATVILIIVLTVVFAELLSFFDRTWNSEE